MIIQIAQLFQELWLDSAKHSTQVDKHGILQIATRRIIGNRSTAPTFRFGIRISTAGSPTVWAGVQNRPSRTAFSTGWGKNQPTLGSNGTKLSVHIRCAFCANTNVNLLPRVATISLDLEGYHLYNTVRIIRIKHYKIDILRLIVFLITRIVMQIFLILRHRCWFAWMWWSGVVFQLCQLKRGLTSIWFPFFNTIFVSSHMYPENPEGTQVIVGSMNMGYISDTARNRTHNLFRLKREPIPLYHSDGFDNSSSTRVVKKRNARNEFSLYVITNFLIELFTCWNSIRDDQPAMGVLLRNRLHKTLVIL